MSWNEWLQDNFLNSFFKIPFLKFLFKFKQNLENSCTREFPEGEIENCNKRGNYE